jgi:hypothetical protein
VESKEPRAQRPADALSLITMIVRSPGRAERPDLHCGAASAPARLPNM